MPLGQELLAAETADINAFLIGNKIRKIEAGDRMLALIFSSGRALLFSWDADWYGLCSAGENEIRSLAGAAKSRPPLASAVKAHLAGAILSQAAVINADRIIEIKFARAIGAGFVRNNYLVLEASGRYSNLLLLDDERTIIETAKHIHPETNRYRTLLPGMSYTPPPPFFGVPLADFYPEDESALQKLPLLAGLGKPLLQAVAKSCQADPGRTLDLLRALKEGGGSLQLLEKGYLTIFPEKLLGSVQLTASDSLSAARNVVSCPLLERSVGRSKTRLRKILENRLELAEKRLADAEKLLAVNDSESTDLLFGRLILENAENIPLRAERALLCEWREEGEVTHAVELSPQLDAAANAARYFARYKRKKAGRVHAKASLGQLRQNRDEASLQLTLMEAENGPEALALLLKEAEGKVVSGKAKTLPPHSRYRLRGADLYVGLSAKGNQYVTFRVASAEDIWFHVQGVSGAHVILRILPGASDEEEERAFELAASCATHYSSIKGEKSRVDFTEKKQVRAITGGGPGRVTYKNFGTVTISGEIWRQFMETGQQ